MVKRLEITIRLEYDNEKTAAAVTDAVSPENLKAPPGIFIETTRKDSCVITVIRGEMKMLSIIYTIDDLLSSASIAENILRTAKGN